MIVYSCLDPTDFVTQKKKTKKKTNFKRRAFLSVGGEKVGCTEKLSPPRTLHGALRKTAEWGECSRKRQEDRSADSTFSENLC